MGTNHKQNVASKPKSMSAGPTSSSGSKSTRLIEAVNKILMFNMETESDEQLAKFCLSVLEEVTGAAFGFIGELNSVGKLDTIALSDPGYKHCRIEEDNLVRLITNMEVRGIWGAVIKSGKSLMTKDPYGHPDSVGTPEGHPPLTSFLGVPLKRGERVTGIIALGNKPNGFTKTDSDVVESLATTIVEAIRNKRTEIQLGRQSKEILELSTPVVQLWENIVAAPLIGTIDSQRAQQFIDAFLNAITRSKSSVAMIDITGVPTIDTQTAQYLIEVCTAANLIGTRVILTGVKPGIAQTLVHLGIDLSELVTRSSLASGFQEALKILNLEVTPKK